MINAYEAMIRAIDCADKGDMDGGRLWLDIARELREDAQFRLMIDPEAIKNDLDERVTRVIKAVREDTQALRPGDATEAEGHCRHCGYAVTHGEKNVLIHTRTGQVMCPGPSQLEWNARRAVVHASAML